MGSILVFTSSPCLSLVTRSHAATCHGQDHRRRPALPALSTLVPRPACGPGGRTVCAKQLRIPLLLCEDNRETRICVLVVNLYILRMLSTVIPKKQVQRALALRSWSWCCAIDLLGLGSCAFSHPALAPTVFTPSVLGGGFW